MRGNPEIKQQQTSRGWSRCTMRRILHVRCASWRPASPVADASLADLQAHPLCQGVAPSSCLMASLGRSGGPFVHQPLPLDPGFYLTLAVLWPCLQVFHGCQRLLVSWTFSYCTWSVPLTFILCCLFSSLTQHRHVCGCLGAQSNLP